MKTVRIHKYNDTPALEETPVPQLAEDQVLVRVQAAALNPLDLLIASGAARTFFPVEFPYTPASDFAGVIEQIGSAVTDWRPGDAVIVWSHPSSGGGLAEFASVPADACTRLPTPLSMAEGAGLPTAASSAWHALFSIAKLRAGETVLIHAGAGGVGTFAIQLAHKAGARVIATASGDGLQLARALGADQVIDHRTEDFAAAVSEADVVLDLVGGDTQARSWNVLSPGGRLVSTVSPPDEEVAQTGGITPGMLYLHQFRASFDTVVDAIVDQGVKTVIDRTIPLTSFPDAWERMQSRKARGKVIVSMA